MCQFSRRKMRMMFKLFGKRSHTEYRNARERLTIIKSRTKKFHGVKKSAFVGNQRVKKSAKEFYRTTHAFSSQMILKRVQHFPNSTLAVFQLGLTADRMENTSHKKSWVHRWSHQFATGAGSELLRLQGGLEARGSREAPVRSRGGNGWQDLLGKPKKK